MEISVCHKAKEFFHVLFYHCVKWDRFRTDPTARNYTCMRQKGATSVGKLYSCTICSILTLHVPLLMSHLPRHRLVHLYSWSPSPKSYYHSREWIYRKGLCPQNLHAPATSSICGISNLSLAQSVVDFKAWFSMHRTQSKTGKHPRMIIVNTSAH